jgi:hypothetical protein
MTSNPSRHDSVTITCPACGRPFVPVGRQRWCSEACRAAGYRRRKQAASPPVVLPTPKPRRPHTVYECDRCGTRSIGEQRCDECGRSPAGSASEETARECDEPVAVIELVGPDLARVE